MTKTATTQASKGFLSWVERVGNRLPDPTTLFIIGTLLVFLLSAAAQLFDWSVQGMLPDLNAETKTVSWKASGDPLRAQNLLSRDGLFWFMKNMDDHFANFPPLKVVLVGMLGIGLAERCGLIAAVLKLIMRGLPSSSLTPAVIFMGIMSSMTLDAGYVVLPPLAVAIFRSAGRSPVVAIAAVFAGVSAGFNANLFITGLDPMLAEFTRTGARVLYADYAVNPACNWYFMVFSTVVITLLGWAVTHWIVERRVEASDYGSPEASQAVDLNAPLSSLERSGLHAAGLVLVVLTGLTLFAILNAHGPLHGRGAHFDRWVESIVPLLFFFFVLPGVAYGWQAGSLRSGKDFARMCTQTMADMAPMIVLSFFAAQFIESFKYSGLDKMLAMTGGRTLASASLPPELLIVAFIGVVMFFNLFIGSMSAKYAMFAPIFVPMFMMVGISPELTQAAYRVGDSVTNIITPLNPYMIIMLAYFQKQAPRGGLGSLISLMLPYTLVFAAVWTIALVLWMLLGLPLGPDGATVLLIPPG